MEIFLKYILAVLSFHGCIKIMFLGNGAMRRTGASSKVKVIVSAAALRIGSFPSQS